MTHNKFYSYVEILGNIMTTISDEEIHVKPYYYMRVMFKDGNSAPKFINTYAWDDLKLQIVDLKLAPGDTIIVKGQLSYIEKDNKCNLRVTSCELLERKVDRDRRREENIEETSNEEPVSNLMEF